MYELLCCQTLKVLNLPRSPPGCLIFIFSLSLSASFFPSPSLLLIMLVNLYAPALAIINFLVLCILLCLIALHTCFIQDSLAVCATPPSWYLNIQCLQCKPVSNIQKNGFWDVKANFRVFWKTRSVNVMLWLNWCWSSLRRKWCISTMSLLMPPWQPIQNRAETVG